METVENMGGGDSVFLTEKDRLDKVPKTHVELITEQIRAAFADPSAYFLSIANKCPFRSMSKWLKQTVAAGKWQLALHQGEWSRRAGFCWFGKSGFIAEIEPADGMLDFQLPKTFQQYYQLVETVSWSSFGCAGGIDGAAGHVSIERMGMLCDKKVLKPNNAFCFGSSFGGDVLIYTSDGRGGWLCHETGTPHFLGTIEDTINWVYAEMTAGRHPDFNYDWLRK